MDLQAYNRSVAPSTGAEYPNFGQMWNFTFF